MALLSTNRDQAVTLKRRLQVPEQTRGRKRTPPADTLPEFIFGRITAVDNVTTPGNPSYSVVGLRNKAITVTSEKPRFGRPFDAATIDYLPASVNSGCLIGFDQNEVATLAQVEGEYADLVSC